MTNRYEVDWVKNYFATGTVEIKANSEAEAEDIAINQIWAYEGLMIYVPDGNETTACRVDSSGNYIRGENNEHN